MAPKPPQKASQTVDPVHWEDLERLDPQAVTMRCRCQWDPQRGYGIGFLGETYWVHPSRRAVEPERSDAPVESYLPLTLVLFLLKAQDRPLAGRMVSERELPGGDFFFRHLHRLPAKPLEEAFGKRPEAFMKIGRRLGGRPTDISEPSFELTPLPRIPLGIHLWVADEEFPARCVFTFDASVHHQLPLDIILALVSVLVQRMLAMQQDQGASSLL